MRLRLRLADADPQPAELLGAELLDDRAQAVVAAGPPALAEAELAERQREVVDDDEHIAERRSLAGEHLAHGEARVVHVRLRLDEHHVEPAEAALDDARRVALPATARPAGPVGQPVEHHPADVVARLPRTARRGSRARRRSSRSLRACRQASFGRPRERAPGRREGRDHVDPALGDGSAAAST